MTLSEAMAQYGLAWLTIWLPILLLGAFVLPLTLLFWNATRVTAVLCVGASVIGGFGVNWLYTRVGYVKILGLPHILAWTPLAVYLWFKMKSPAAGKTPRIIISMILGVITISLAFDYHDVIRYMLGDRIPPA